MSDPKVTFDASQLQALAAAAESSRIINTNLSNIALPEFDPTNLKTMLETLTAVNSRTAKTSDDFDLIQKATKTLSEEMAKMSKYDIIDPRQVELVKTMEKMLKAMGVTEKYIVATQKQATQHLGAQVVAYDKLNKKEKEYVDRLKEARRVAVLPGGQTVELQTKEGDRKRDVVKSIKEKTWGAAKYGANLGGIQLSIGGIIKLLIEMYDIHNKISGLTDQVSYRWGGFRKVAGGALHDIRSGFKMGYDEAGKLAMSMTRAGMSTEGFAARLPQQMKAIEVLSGVSTDSQLQFYGALTTNFEASLGAMGSLGRKTTDINMNAMDFEQTIINVAKNIPMLSFDQALADVSELVDKTKAYNTDLLGTLGLYNMLMRKDLSSKLGLGDAPRAIKKDIAVAVSGMSANLAIGWKAALGKASEEFGASPASRVLEFESKKPGEQFRRAAEFLLKATQDKTGANRIIAMRTLMEQMNFTNEETRKVLADALVKTAPAALAEAFSDIGTQALDLETAAKDAAKKRDDTIQKGMNTATKLVGALEKIKIWLQDLLQRFITPLIEAIKTAIWAIQHPLEAAEQLGEAIGSSVFDALNPSKDVAEGARGGELHAALKKQMPDIEKLEKLGMYGQYQAQVAGSLGAIHMQQRDRINATGKEEDMVRASEAYDIAIQAAKVKNKQAVKWLLKNLTDVNRNAVMNAMFEIGRQGFIDEKTMRRVESGANYASNKPGGEATVVEEAGY